MHVCILSHVRFFKEFFDSFNPWTVAHQAALSMGFFQARILEWVAPPPGDLPDLGIEPMSPELPALASRFFTTEPLEKPIISYGKLQTFGQSIL